MTSKNELRQGGPQPPTWFTLHQLGLGCRAFFALKTKAEDCRKLALEIERELPALL